MEYAIVDKNGKFIGKTTNKLISQVPYPRYGILPMYLKMRLEFQTNNERILKCIKENIFKHNIIITEIIVQASHIKGHSKANRLREGFLGRQETFW